MKKWLLLPLLALFMVSCSVTHPFIDVEDVMAIQPNMTQDMVLEALGEPTEIRGGVVTDSGDVVEVWRYRMKKMKARQQFDLNALFPPMFMPRSKPGDNWRSNHWIGEVNYDFIFKNDVLVKWGYPMDDWPSIKEEAGEIIAPMRYESKKGKWGFLQRIPIIRRFF